MKNNQMFSYCIDGLATRSYYFLVNPCSNEEYEKQLRISSYKPKNIRLKSRCQLFTAFNALFNQETGKIYFQTKTVIKFSKKFDDGRREIYQQFSDFVYKFRNRQFKDEYLENKSIIRKDLITKIIRNQREIEICKRKIENEKENLKSCEKLNGALLSNLTDNEKLYLELQKSNLLFC